MQSKAAIFGHPIHPMLVSFPIAGFTVTVLADIVYLLSDRTPLWYDIAFWAAVFGVVTGLLAGLFGAIDNFLIVQRTNAAKTGNVHAALNLLAIVLIAISIYFRVESSPIEGGSLTLPFILALVGLGAVMISGWLGGELVFKHHIGMDPDSVDSARDEEDYHDLRRAA